MNSATEQIRAWAAQAEQTASAATALADGVAALRATVRRGEITVTVDASGALLGLELGAGACDQGPRQLAASILSNVRSAKDEVYHQLTAVVSQTVGVDSPTGAALIELQRRRLLESR
jgi:hypothetical protein